VKRGAPVGLGGTQSVLHRAGWLTAAALWAATAVAQQSLAGGANLFAPSSQTGKIIDAERALPITAFYGTPAVEMPAEPGTLVRAEPASDYALPPGITATRILYHTRTANNEDTLASGVVLVPYGQPPKEGWPLLAWSHGTSGVAINCAPSLMRTLFYNWEGLYEYVLLGYAVVATDYAGLGTKGRHAYLDMLSNGGDVINSVPAAHAAVPNLSKKWLVVGHSQGGLSSLGVAQLEAEIRDPNFIGTVSLAGASDLEDGINAIERAKLPVLNGLVAFWIYGVKTLYPDLNLNHILTNKGLAIYNECGRWMQRGKRCVRRSPNGSNVAPGLGGQQVHPAISCPQPAWKAANLRPVVPGGRWRRHPLYRICRQQDLSAPMQWRRANPAQCVSRSWT
jgi:Secretory lipase